MDSEAAWPNVQWEIVPQLESNKRKTMPPLRFTLKQKGKVQARLFKDLKKVLK